MIDRGHLIRQPSIEREDGWKIGCVDQIDCPVRVPFKTTSIDPIGDCVAGGVQDARGVVTPSMHQLLAVMLDS